MLFTLIHNFNNNPNHNQTLTNHKFSFLSLSVSPKKTIFANVQNNLWRMFRKLCHIFMVGRFYVRKS